MLFATVDLRWKSFSIKSCGRWSDIREVKFPEKVSNSIEFRKILTMSVFEFFVNLVGWRMQGAKISDISVFISAFKRCILKSPISIHVFSSFCIFVSSGVKYSLINTYGLYLHIKLWIWFDYDYVLWIIIMKLIMYHNAIKTKGYTLN